MKKLLALLFIGPLLSPAQAQNAFSVCNAPGTTANYTTLQGAVDSVPAGSILYVFPSPNDYGNIVLRKKMILYGTGFMLDQNSGYYTAPNQYGVTLTSIDFEPGSDNSYVEGLQMIGLTQPPGNIFRFYLDSVTNIIVSRCMTDTWSGFAGNTEIVTVNTFNCSFDGCYMYLGNLNNPNHSAGGFYQEQGIGSQNLQFNNNIIDSRTYSTSLSMSAGPNGFGTMVFTNNTIICGVPGSNFGSAVYVNNFFINTNKTSPFTAASVAMTGAAINNITNTPNLFTPGSGNGLNVNPDSIFAYTTFGYHSFDQSWQVGDTSFANSFATDGGQVGAYGGASPYILSGIPHLPNIYALTVSTDTAHPGHILVRVQGKANY